MSVAGPEIRPARATLHAAALDSVPTASVLLDNDGYLVDANHEARQVFGLAPRDNGLPFRDLEISYQPVELRAPIAQAHTERRRIVLNAIGYTPPGAAGPRSFDIEIVPLYAGNEALGAAVFFNDRTRHHELQEQLRQANAELQQTYQEVQSTNEELETMNEELQSTNDELHIVNDELQVAGEKLDRVNRFLEGILMSLRGGVVVLDRDHIVQRWNSRAQDLWGLREDEVQGSDFLSLDIGLPVSRLKRALSDALAGNTENAAETVDAVTRRGRAVRCRVSFTPLRARHGIDGAIAVMEILDGNGSS